MFIVVGLGRAYASKDAFKGHPRCAFKFDLLATLLTVFIQHLETCNLQFERLNGYNGIKAASHKILVCPVFYLEHVTLVLWQLSSFHNVSLHDKEQYDFTKCLMK